MTSSISNRDRFNQWLAEGKKILGGEDAQSLYDLAKEQGVTDKKIARKLGVSSTRIGKKYGRSK